MPGVVGLSTSAGQPMQRKGRLQQGTTKGGFRKGFTLEGMC